MAHSKVYLKNPRTGVMREAPVGFSWTVLFFGWFPPLFRKDWWGFLIMLLVGCATLGLSNLVFMFIYNKMYLKSLVRDGFEVTSATADVKYLEQKLGLLLPQAA